MGSLLGRGRFTGPRRSARDDVPPRPTAEWVLAWGVLYSESPALREDAAQALANLILGEWTPTRTVVDITNNWIRHRQEPPTTTGGDTA